MRRPAVLLAVLCAVVAATVLGSGSPAGAASATGAASAASPAPSPTSSTDAAVDESVEVTLLELSPLAPTATDVLTISGTVTNRSDEQLTNLNAYLRMSRTATTERADVALLTAPDFRAAFRPGPFVPLGPTLAPGASLPFRLDVPVEELGFTSPGVYPVGIEVLAGFADGSRAAAGRSLTMVPWLGAEPDAAATLPPVQVAAVVPLTAPVDRAPDGSYLSDDLGALLGPSGELGALVDAAPGTPDGRFGPAVTWLLDPAVVEAAADLSDGYEVRRDPADGSAVRPGVHADDASAWLARVADLVDAGAVALLPYANVDVVALVRAGMAADVGAALESAQSRASAALAAAGLATTEPLAMTPLYPPGGAVDADTLEALASAGVRTLLLSDTSVDTGSADSDGAGAVQLDAGAGQVTAVVSDSVLDAVLAAPAGTLAARQLSLAHTALAALGGERSGGGPLVVVPLASPPPAAVGALEVLTGGVPWVQPVRVLDTLTRVRLAATLTYPPTAQTAELPPDHLDGVAALEASAGTLESLTDVADSAGTLLHARLRAESAAWRTDPGGAATIVAVEAAELDGALARVRIVTTGTVTLSSDAGRFPVTVANDLDEPVTVRLSLTSGTPARLQATAPDLVQVAAGAKTTIDVSAQATSNGEYRLDARLETADGTPFGAATPITLRATQYDTVAWIVMAVAAGLIFVGSGRRLFQRARASRSARR